MPFGQLTARVSRAIGGRWLPLKWGLAVAVFILGLQVLGIFRPVEDYFTDQHFILRGKLDPSGKVVVVGISPQCTRQLGQWPWPRAYHAQLIDKLTEAGAKVICFDMYFSTPAAKPENDAALVAAAGRAGNVILATYKRDTLDQYLGRDGPLLVAKELAHNLPALATVVQEGHINVRHDRDGVIRRVPAGLTCKGVRHYQFGLLAAARYLGVQPNAIRVERGGLRVGGRYVPVDSSGNLLINYYGLATQLRTYFVSSILDGAVKPEAFRDKVVFIGQTDHGLQNADLVVTPEGERFGVYVQAAVADNIISGRVLRRAPFWALALVVLAFSMGCASRLFVRRVLGKVAWSIAFAAAAVLVSHYVFVHFHVLLDLTPCLATVVVGNLYGALVFGLLRADKEVARRELEMATLLEAGNISAQGQVVELPQQIVASIGRAVGVEGCCLFLRRGGEVELAASYGFGESLSAGEAAAASEAANRWVAHEQRPFFADGSPRSNGARLADLRIRSAVLVPLASHDQLYGTLGFYNKRPSEMSQGSEFSEHDFRLISLLTQQTTLTLERSHLADNLQEALRNLEAAQQKLLESERLSAVGKMANMIIHDIKNPMQGIRMFAEMAADATISPEQRHEFSDTMCHEIDRLTGMCQEILDFARGTSNLAKEDVPLDAYLLEVLAALTPELEQTGTRLETDLHFGGVLRLDANRTKRVVLNLCRNAIEAMGKNGGTLRVATSRQAERARVEIADTGPGIPPEIAPRLFEPFATYGKENGTGLGLAIVKKIVEDHGGTIRFATAAGKGTTFAFEFPIAAESQAVPEAATDAQPSEDTENIACAPTSAQ